MSKRQVLEWWLRKYVFFAIQIVSRNMTNLTPAQLEEFEHAFRHFATEHSNTLSIEGFVAAMASLGLFFHEEEIEAIFAKVTGRREEATFEQFIRFMVSITEDKSTPEQLQDAFWTIAGEKPYVTELDLKMCMVPEPAIQYLMRDMPASANGFDYDRYVQQMFR